MIIIDSHNPWTVKVGLGPLPEIGVDYQLLARKIDLIFEVTIAIGGKTWTIPITYVRTSLYLFERSAFESSFSSDLSLCSQGIESSFSSDFQVIWVFNFKEISRVINLKNIKHTVTNVTHTLLYPTTTCPRYLGWKTEALSQILHFTLLLIIIEKKYFGLGRIFCPWHWWKCTKGLMWYMHNNVNVSSKNRSR